MDSFVRVSAGLVGLAIIGCVAHSAIVAGGGYGATGAPLLIALACGLAVGAVAGAGAAGTALGDCDADRP